MDRCSFLIAKTASAKNEMLVPGGNPDKASSIAPAIIAIKIVSVHVVKPLSEKTIATDRSAGSPVESIFGNKHSTADAKTNCSRAKTIIEKSFFIPNKNIFQ